jgi:signal transduction histidine kinase
LIEHFIEDEKLSLAWGRALEIVARQREVAALTVALTGFDHKGRCVEDPAIRRALDAVLRSRRHGSVETVANTIFPESLWNPDASSADLYARYTRILPKLRRVRANSHGTYFERMIDGGPEGAQNQIEFALQTYNARPGVRRSVLQLGIFDPKRDHSASALRGFPCLQHVTFAPTVEGLYVNAFYATQYMVERAYGNYLGISRLGRFIAHELRLPLRRVTVFTGLAQRDGTLSGLERLLELIRRLRHAEEAD